MATNYPINPRVRALGKARLDVARRAQSPADWQALWKQPAHPFPFSWGERWKQCVEYRVDDFAAEVGFFIDILGLPVNALDPDYAMFTSPEGDFFFAVVPASQTCSTPPEAIRLQFMLADIFATVDKLESRGIAFEQPPQPVQPGSTLHIATFLTPHGICIDLWGMVEQARRRPAAEEQDDQDVFLPGEEDDPLSLFATQDAAPLALSPQKAPIPAPHRPQAVPQDDLEEEDDLDLFDEDDEPDDEIEAADDPDDEEDDDDIEYVDIDTA